MDNRVKDMEITKVVSMESEIKLKINKLLKTEKMVEGYNNSHGYFRRIGEITLYETHIRIRGEIVADSKRYVSNILRDIRVMPHIKETILDYLKD